MCNNGNLSQIKNQLKTNKILLHKIKVLHTILMDIIFKLTYYINTAVYTIIYIYIYIINLIYLYYYHCGIVGNLVLVFCFEFRMSNNTFKEYNLICKYIYIYIYIYMI